METAFFIFYLALFGFIISILPFFKNSGIGKLRLLILFIIKILAGVAYAKFYSLPQYYEGSDTWRFYRQSLTEKEWLLHDPIAFVKDLFVYGYDKTGNLFKGENTYWNDLKSNIPVKMMAVMNVFTNSSYYCNIIFFNFLFLFGLVALFKMFYRLYPQKRDLITVGVFLLPSALFWCSGIHKDGLILSATGLTIYCLYKEMEESISIKRSVIIGISLLLIFALRNYVLFALLPATAAWILSKKNSSKSIKIYAVIYILCIAIMFVTPLFSSLNFPLFIAEKQHEFLLLSGSSAVVTKPLQPDFLHFISFLPGALDMAFFRPHITEIKNLSYIPAAAETLLLVLLVVICIVSIRAIARLPAVVLFLFVFSLSVMLLCGYTIPFTGAIVRYRSFVLPLLITPLLCIADFNYLIGKFRRK